MGGESVCVGGSPSRVLSSDVFLRAARWAGAGTGHRRVLGYLLLSWTGSGQHGPAQDIKEGAAPRDEDGSTELKPAFNSKFIF